MQRRQNGYLSQLIHDSSLNLFKSYWPCCARRLWISDDFQEKNEWLGCNIYTAEFREASSRLTNVFCAVNKSTIMKIVKYVIG